MSSSTLHFGSLRAYTTVTRMPLSLLSASSPHLVPFYLRIGHITRFSPSPQLILVVLYSIVQYIVYLPYSISLMTIMIIMTIPITVPIQSIRWLEAWSRAREPRRFRYFTHRKESFEPAHIGSANCRRERRRHLSGETQWRKRRRWW